MDDDKGLMAELSEHAPTIFFWFVLICQVVGEIRVWDIMYKLTSSYWAAAGASFSTGIPLILWEIGLQYKLGSIWQRLMAGLMIAVTFIYAMYIGTVDLLAAWSGTGNVPAGNILVGLGILFAVQIVAGLVFFYTDPEKALQRRTATMEARYAFRAKAIALQTNLLTVENEQERALDALEQTHGRRARRMAGKLGLRAERAGDAVAPVVTNTTTKANDDGFIDRLAELVPVLKEARANGNGANPH